MRISAIGQQDLITQIYLKDDPNLETDPSTRSPLSINRILPLKKRNDTESELEFDIVLKKEYLPDEIVFQKVSGTYSESEEIIN
jgi:protocatechuate 3,4-dioxygenase beta subunit